MEIPFVEKIENRLSKLEATLNNEQRLKYQFEIDTIYRLLDLFKDSGGVSKVIKEKIDEATKDLKKMVGDGLIATKGLSPTKPNIDSLDTDTINKAKMTKASSIFLETDGNEMATNEILKDTGYLFDKDLSTNEGLVLHNPETNDVKVAFRGTSTSFKRPFDSIKDLTHDARFITGTEAYGREGGSLSTARDLINSAKNKYGNVNELVGYSLGGQKSLLLGDEFGIKTTTFNPLIGLNSMRQSSTNTEHNIFRTTEDITSLGAGFGTYKSNWNIKSILPKKLSLDPRKAHHLSNFLDNDDRYKGRSLLDIKVAKVIDAGKKKAQTEDLTNTMNEMEQNLNREYPSREELLEEDPFGDLPRPPIRPKQEYTSRGEALYETRGSKFEIDTIDDLNRQVGIKPPLELPDAPTHRAGTAKPIRQSHFNPNDFKNKNARQMVDMKKGEYETFNIDDTMGEPLSEDMIGSARPKIEGKASDIDLSRLTGTTETKQPTIKDINLDDALDFMRTKSERGSIGGDYELTSLSNNEKQNIVDSTPTERDSFVDNINEDYNTAVSDLDNHIKIPIGDENIKTTGIVEDIARGLHPTNLVGGFVGGMLSQGAVDWIDPDRKIQKQGREALVGVGAGGLTGFGSYALGAGSLGALAPEMASGGLAFLAGSEAGEAITKATGSEAAGDVGGGGVGGGVGASTLLLGTGIAGDIATGSTIGTFFDPITFGAGTLVGASVGGILGGIAYGIHKL